MKRASILAVVLLVAACSSATTGQGHYQELMRTWGTTLGAATVTIDAINQAALIACTPTATAPAAVKREDCQQIDVAGLAAESLLHQATAAVKRAEQSEVVDTALLVDELKKALDTLRYAAGKAGVKWLQ